MKFFNYYGLKTWMLKERERWEENNKEFWTNFPIEKESKLKRWLNEKV